MIEIKKERLQMVRSRNGVLYYGLAYTSGITRLTRPAYTYWRWCMVHLAGREIFLE